MVGRDSSRWGAYSIVPMASQQPAHSRQSANDDTEDIQSTLAALQDDTCRRILVAAEERPMTASEIADSCDLPMSTTYRKVNMLTDAGLLDGRLRLRRDGNHANEYVAHRASINLEMAEEGSELRLRAADDERWVQTGSDAGCQQ